MVGTCSHLRHTYSQPPVFNVHAPCHSLRIDWGCKPDLSHLYVFGSVCYPLVVLASKRVDAHPLKYLPSCGIFLGYAENCPGVVCLNPVAGKLSVRCDLLVDENYQFHRPTVGAPCSFG